MKLMDIISVEFKVQDQFVKYLRNMEMHIGTQAVHNLLTDSKNPQSFSYFTGFFKVTFELRTRTNNVN